PYARITGTGDYSYDIYSFDVSPAPSSIDPIRINDTTVFPGTADRSNHDTSTYYSSVTFVLTGKVKTGDVWVLGIGYRDFATSPAAPGTSLLNIANEFKSMIDTAKSNHYIDDGYAVDNPTV